MTGGYRGPETAPAPDPTNNQINLEPSGPARYSQQVNWLTVLDFTAPWLTGSWPMVGSVEWQQLPDDDPAKWAALLDAARHWALRVETMQQAECEAAQAISAGADWRAIATQIRNRAKFYAERPWMKRITA